MSLPKSKSVVSPPEVELPEPFLIDVHTAAKLMYASVFCVRELLRSSELLFVKVGMMHLVSPSAIREWVRRKEADAKADLRRNRGVAARARLLC